MLIQLSIEELNVLWKLDYFQECQQLGIIIIREDGSDFILDIVDRKRFLSMSNLVMESEIEKELMKTVQST
jgi:hypothetical protein